MTFHLLHMLTEVEQLQRNTLKKTEDIEEEQIIKQRAKCRNIEKYSNVI